MLKRICSFFLAFVLLQSVAFVLPAAAADKSEVQLLVDLGIIDISEPATLLPSSFTRADFAASLSKLNSKFHPYVTDGEEEGKYARDIKGNENYDYIATMLSLGYMENDSENNFNPSQPITKNDAIKALLRVLGYDIIAESNGGTASAYNAMAQKAGLLKGVKIENSGKLTAKEVADILANAMSIRFFSPAGVNYGDECFYTGWNISKNSGKILANSNLGLATERTDYRNVNIDEKIYYTELLIADELVGSTVDYYTVSGDRGDEVVSIYVKLNNDNVTINAADIESVTETSREIKLVYDEGEKISIAKNAYAVVNGKTCSPTKKLFDAFKSGSVTFVDTQNDGRYDIAHMTLLVQCVIQGVNPAKETVALKYDNQKIDLEKAEVYEVYLNNKAASLADLSSDMVVGVACDSFTFSEGEIVYKYDGAELVKLYASNNMAEGFVDAMEDELIYVDDTPHKLGAGYHRLLKKGSITEIELGEYVKIYKDTYGEIACYEIDTAKSSIKYGYLIKSAMSSGGLSKCLELKIMDASGNINIFRTDKKFVLDGEKLAADSTQYSVDGNEIDLNRRQVVKYKEADGILRELDTQILTKYESAGKSLASIGYFDHYGSGESEKKCFRSIVDNKFAVSSDAVIFLDEALLTDENPDDSDFSIYKLPNDTKEYIIGYDADENSIVKVAAIWKAYGETEGVEESGDSRLSPAVNGMVVKNIRWALDKNGEEGYRIYLAGDGVNTSYFTRTDKLKLYEIDSSAENSGWNSEYLTVKKVDSSKLLETVDKGDVIRIALSTDNEITHIEKIFDYSEITKGEYKSIGTVSSGGQYYGFVKLEKVEDKFLIYKDSEDSKGIITKNMLLGTNAVYHVESEETEVLPHEQLPTSATGDDVWMFVRIYSYGLKDGILYVYD